ncbi:unnamed protein product [Pleuronectes platessa]|uniref:Uncharacterized protein n=1 Tax=Pleuronectes platessa TaxID=8262 RepID=A0A9N7V3W9_PLEPL|nr:unnamed protein product [Pleuronectes platessa]
MLLPTTAMDRQTDRETDFSAGGLKTGSQLQHPSRGGIPPDPLAEHQWKCNAWLPISSLASVCSVALWVLGRAQTTAPAGCVLLQPASLFGRAWLRSCSLRGGDRESQDSSMRPSRGKEQLSQK